MTFDQQISSILDSIELGHTDILPSEWIENNRFIQHHVSEKMFGKFDFSNAPYMRKIVDYLSPYSPVTHCALMKGVRIGGTFALVHNGVPYVMSERPTNILLLSANKELAKKTIQGVDNGIDGCDIRHLLGKGSGVKTNISGDTTESKTFSGGFELVNFGGQAINNMKQITAGLIVADEVDAYKISDTKFGSFTDVMEDRAFSLGDSKKIFYLGSPGLMENSLIYKLYLEGDQQVYYVPCPHCGEMIEFVWNERNENGIRYGIIFDVKNSEVVRKSVRYRCGSCENEFEEKLKQDLLNAGEWQSSIQREDVTFASHRLNTLYAPVTMSGWYDIAKKYQKAFPRGGIKEEAKYHSFVNSYEGMPYKPEGQTLKSTQLQKNRREYDIGECPFKLAKKDNNGEIIIITAQCDLNGYEDDGRLDYSIVAHSEKGPTYSIDAGSVGTFIPKVERTALEKQGKDVGKIQHKRVKYTYRHNVENNIWDEFEQNLLKTYGDYNRKVTILSVDVGAFDDHAKAFVKKMRKHNIFCIGVKGEKQENFIAQSKTEYGYVYKYSQENDIYLLNVNVIKDRLAGYMNATSYIDDDNELRQDTHFMNFPRYDTEQKKYTYRNFFAHYESEHKLTKQTEGSEPKYLWEKKKSGIQNHFWDVEVYCIFNRILMTEVICSNDNLYKRKYYKTEKIEATWENACRLIIEASKQNNKPLS